jgi:predicted metal-dependent hydrolase
MSAAFEAPAELRQVTYGSERIDFLLSRRQRKTLAITVHPDLRVEVIAPLDAEESAIITRVQARARWILRQRRQFLSWMPKPMPRQYHPGETHRYLGKQYRLKVIVGIPDKVCIKGSFIEVQLSTGQDATVVKKLMIAWYRQRAETRFQQEMAKALKRLRLHGLATPKLRLLRMPKRWGSCTAKGEILINPELIKTPCPCIEYVIIHELCHLQHPNHSTAFFRMLDAVLPDWRERKQRLERSEI